MRLTTASADRKTPVAVRTSLEYYLFQDRLENRISFATFLPPPPTMYCTPTSPQIGYRRWAIGMGQCLKGSVTEEELVGGFASTDMSSPNCAGNKITVEGRDKITEEGSDEEKATAVVVVKGNDCSVAMTVGLAMLAVILLVALCATSVLLTRYKE